MVSSGIVYVSSLTYKRPHELAHLLPSLKRLTLPAGWDVRFLIVDNDPQESARSHVEAALASFGGALGYVAEHTPGIPAARNRALKEALDANATLLCFLDDDETPDPEWLTELVSYWCSEGTALVGGPVRRLFPNKPLSLGQRLIGRSIIARRIIDDRRAARKAVSGTAPAYTGNWMCDLSAIRQHDLWFDMSLQFTGGSDTAFNLAVQNKGLPTGWCDTAIIYETLDPERMTARYQYRRGRTHGIVKAGLVKQSWLATAVRQFPRAVIGAGLMIVPVLGIGSYSLGLHMIGSAVGHFSHFLGGKSVIYAYGRANA